MLPRPYRLTKERDFGRALRYGRSFFVPSLKWKVHKNNLSHPRFGIVLSNRFVKKASGRNQVKRWIRAILLRYYKRVTGGVDIVLICRGGIEKENYQTLGERIAYSLKTLRLLR